MMFISWMTILNDIRRFALHAAGAAMRPLVWSALVAYFAFYTVNGDRGLNTLTILEKQVAAAEATAAQLAQEREQLELRVRLMRPDSLDLDLLDERARLNLNYSHPDDLVVMTGQPRRPSGPSVVAGRP